MIRCDNGSNPVIRGFDFSLHGGVGIYDASCRNLAIEMNKFVVGPNCTIAINQSAAASAIIIRGNFIDGGGYVSACATDPVGENILLGGSGSKVVEYNWIRNAAQHFLTLSGSGNTARVRYNLAERCGFFQGNHCNGIQFVGGSWAAPIISHNTFISDQPDVHGDLHGLANFEAGSNTAVTGSAYGLVTLEHTYAASLASGMSIASPNLPSGTTIASVSNSGGPCCAGPGTHPVITTLVLSQKAVKTGRASFDIPNAYPSGLVNPIQIDAQLHALIRNAQIDDNVVVAAPGPVTTVSYAISIDSDDSSLNVGASVMNNYVDARGAYGAFYPADCLHAPHCHGATFLGNVDMTTGAAIRPLRR